MSTVGVYSSLGMHEEVIEAIEAHLSDSQLPEGLDFCSFNRQMEV